MELWIEKADVLAERPDLKDATKHVDWDDVMMRAQKEVVADIKRMWFNKRDFPQGTKFDPSKLTPEEWKTPIAEKSIFYILRQIANYEQGDIHLAMMTDFEESYKRTMSSIMEHEFDYDLNGDSTVSDNEEHSVSTSRIYV